MGAGLMLVEFEDLNDRNCVMNNGPWNFDKCIILVKESEGGQQVKNIKLKEAAFWVWVHDLSLIARNDYVVAWLWRGRIG